MTILGLMIMKKLFVLFMALGAMSLFVACGEDEAFGENEIVVDGAVVPIEGGFYNDYQTNLSTGWPLRSEGSNYTHTLRSIILYDNIVDQNNMYVFVDLYAANPEDFETGTFTVMTFDDEVDANTGNVALISGNFNPEVYEAVPFRGVSGKITFKGEPSEATMTFSVQAESSELNRVDGSTDAITVKGQFKGELMEE